MYKTGLGVGKSEHINLKRFWHFAPYVDRWCDVRRANYGHIVIHPRKFSIK